MLKAQQVKNDVIFYGITPFYEVVNLFGNQFDDTALGMIGSEGFETDFHQIVARESFTVSFQS